MTAREKVEKALEEREALLVAKYGVDWKQQPNYDAGVGETYFDQTQEDEARQQGK